MATLLHYPLCPFSRSIRLALAECGVEAALTEERPWDWRPAFLEINPAGSLPVLMVDAATPLVGAYAISEYLDETAGADDTATGGFRPFPGDEIARAEARRLTDWFHRKFHDEVTAYLVDEKVYRRYGPGGGYGMGPGMMGGFGPGYGLYGLDLTSDQRAKIGDIQREFAEKRWELMGKLHAQDGPMSQAFAGPFDEKAARKAYEAMTDAHKKMFEASLQMRKKVEAVLTPEQREQMGRGWRGRGPR